MAYTEKNYPSKKALKEDLQQDRVVMVFQPGPFGPEVPDGPTVLEGPHFPEPHRWYASCKVRDGQVVPGTLR